MSYPTVDPAPEEQLEKLKTVIEDVIRENYSHLAKVLRSALTDFVTHLVPYNILTDAVVHHPTYEGVIGDFKAKLPYLKTVHDVEIHCRNFVCALDKVGGGASDAADALREQWYHDAAGLGYQDFLIEECESAVNIILHVHV